MRDFTFKETDRPTLQEFNRRFSEIGGVLNGLGNEYVWEKTKTEYAEAIGETVTKSGGKWTEPAGGILVSSAVVVDGGAVSLVNPVSLITITTEADVAAQYLVGKYADINNDGSVYLVKSAQYISSNMSITATQITAKPTTRSFGYVNSSDPNAYPVDDGYTYIPLGMLGEKTRIETGSYTGTGTYGESNPNSLTFGFEPQMVLVQESGNSYNGGFPWVRGAKVGKTHFVASTTREAKITWGGMSISWYEFGNSTYQLNDSGTTYNYIAIG